MEYPCTTFVLNRRESKHADNLKYINLNSYLVTVIDEDPDSNLPDKIFFLPYCTFDRPYMADGLHHWVFSIWL